MFPKRCFLANFVVGFVRGRAVQTIRLLDHELYSRRFVSKSRLSSNL